jgi:hypothetical protein
MGPAVHAAAWPKTSPNLPPAHEWQANSSQHVHLLDQKDQYNKAVWVTCIGTGCLQSFITTLSRGGTNQSNIMRMCLLNKNRRIETDIMSCICSARTAQAYSTSGYHDDTKTFFRIKDVQVGYTCQEGMPPCRAPQLTWVCQWWYLLVTFVANLWPMASSPGEMAEKCSNTYIFIYI